MIAPIDIALANAVTFNFLKGAGLAADARGIPRQRFGPAELVEIEFQFPPRITSDNRAAEWREGNLPGSEPVAVYEKSTAREMRLEWTYIVGASSDTDWTTEKIAANVRNLRRYFSKEGNLIGEELIVNFKMWMLGGIDTFTCRIKSVGISHSKTIIVPVSSGKEPPPAPIRGNADVDKAYPLRTDVSCELRLWTKGGVTTISGSRIDVKGLRPTVPLEWF